ncbi:hypothetical protein V1J52_00910 [Streptomyces sp. TRM 70351]|uniref:hypothetical protein n=1 Tax=Streptomyces sp. TRM 70351 TaxID=3116552 RepID=UPI002E7B7CEF|nr:hypothetical protein [Streptomyces sp. TRM 70351]MEE1926754.1 hypothetical protein [Streptomyces sp. TRM 70351]
MRTTTDARAKSPDAVKPSLSVSVMTHPDRMNAAERIRERLGPQVDVLLAVDPEPDGPRSALRSARLAFSQARESGATHHLVLQDDVEVPDGFVDSALRGVAVHPEAALSYFVEWGSRTAVLARWAALTGVGAVPVVNPYVPTVALCLPAALAGELGGFLESEAYQGEADDQAVLRFVRATGTRALVTVPNLVEHSDLPSIVGNTGHGARRSVSFPAEPSYRDDASVLDVPRLMPFFAWNTGAALVIDTANDVPATQRPALDVLAAWGTDEAALRESFAAAVGTAAAGARVFEAASREQLFSVWLIAVAMGRCSGGSGRTRSPCSAAGWTIPWRRQPCPHSLRGPCASSPTRTHCSTTPPP